MIGTAKSAASAVFTFQYVSINTPEGFHSNLQCFSFTFQYVSINTTSIAVFLDCILYLHSNMFLLIPNPVFMDVTVKAIYIPICFY